MDHSSRLKTFSDHYPFIGPAMWMLSLQFYVIQLIVALNFKSSYSLSRNTISDLGNTACGLYDGRYVCSPEHYLMNASLIVLGSFMALGSLLIYQEFKETTGSLLGFSALAIGGIGTLLVGLFPENSALLLHKLGALMPFLIGNLGIVLLALKLNLPKSLRLYSLVSGIAALVALIFFLSAHYLGLGIGGMERLTAYPQSCWLIVFGIYISSSHYLKRVSRRLTISSYTKIDIHYGQE